MDAQSARRISALACQLTGGVGGITAEACAANTSLRYGRPVSADARFARPCTLEQAGLDCHKEAALQQAVRTYAAVGRKDPLHDLPHPPAFARPAIASVKTDDTSMRKVAVSHVPHLSAPHSTGWKPAVSASESERAYSVLLALPGLDARSLRINQSGRRLTVSGSRSRAAAGQGAARFAFAWDLPADVDLGGIRAHAFDSSKDPLLKRMGRQAASTAPLLGIHLPKVQASR